jgi:hypothetical protein
MEKNMKGLRSLVAFGSLLAALPVASASAATVNSDPLPRVEDRLCPGIVGMDADPAVTVLDRIRYNAVRLGIRLDNPETCAPNLVIWFVPDASESFNRLMDDEPRLFRDASIQEKRRLRVDDAPALAWNVVRTRTRDGMPVTRREGHRDIPEARMWSAHSKIYTATREDIVSTVVMFDVGAVESATLKQLGDYISMRAFANDYSGHDDAGGSILTLFDAGGARPTELTEADFEFLASLYDGMANIPGSVRKREIESEIGG